MKDRTNDLFGVLEKHEDFCTPEQEALISSVRATESINQFDPHSLINSVTVRKRKLNLFAVMAAVMGLGILAVSCAIKLHH